MSSVQLALNADDLNTVIRNRSALHAVLHQIRGVLADLLGP
jgi:hypothetical protein